MSSEEKPMVPSVAELAHIAVPPALIDAARNDPDILVQIARSQAMIVQDRMVRKVLENPESSISQYVAVHERLTKTARVDAAQPVQGGGQKVIVNFTFLGKHEEKIAIEGEAQRVETSE